MTVVDSVGRISQRHLLTLWSPQFESIVGNISAILR
jgi:hypothetical protein